MSSRPRAPITTHVLDQTTGLPAKSVSCTLELVPSEGNELRPSWTANTSDTDGRVNHWEKGLAEVSVEDVIQDSRQKEARGSEEHRPLRWCLTFHTEEYWGKGKTFYPKVVIEFVVDVKDPRAHWHVPVLLGPYGYTTYRGS